MLSILIGSRYMAKQHLHITHQMLSHLEHIREQKEMKEYGDFRNFF